MTRMELCGIFLQVKIMAQKKNEFEFSDFNFQKRHGG